MAGGFRPGSDSADLSDMRRQVAMGEQLRSVAPSPEASLLERLSTPATWEQKANAWLRDVLRRASTPAKWEHQANAVLMRLLGRS